MNSYFIDLFEPLFISLHFSITPVKYTTFWCPEYSQSLSVCRINVIKASIHENDFIFFFIHLQNKDINTCVALCS